MTMPRIVLRRVKITGVHLVDKGDNPGAVVCLYKRHPAREFAKVKTVEEILAGLPEEDRKTVEAALLAASKPIEAPAEEGQMMPVEDGCGPKPSESKAMPCDVQKKLDDYAAMSKRLSDLESERRLEKMQKRIDTECAALPGIASADLAASLKRIEDAADKADLERVMTVLKSASATLAKSAAFGEIGTSATETSDVDAKVEAMANALREQNKAMTQAQARVEVYKKHPEIYAAKRGEAK